MRRLVLLSAALLLIACYPAGARDRAEAEPPRTATLPFQRVAGRLLVTLTFRRPDGRTRDALAWVNMGTPEASLSAALARDIGRSPGEPLTFCFGGLPIEVAAGSVAANPPELDGEDALAHLFAPRVVEVILPASTLMQYDVAFDFAARQMTLGRPGTLPPQGIATPLQINPDTRVIAVTAAVDGERHDIALDVGASFTWLRGDVAAGWLAAHPGWLRAKGAVGPSNMGLTGLAFERRGILLRLPEVDIGPVRLGEVGALGTAPLLCGLCDRVVGDLFWDGWAKNAPVPVVGWIGTDVLGDFRLTIDYRNRTLYWLRQRASGARAIDQVGLTLVRYDGAYAIGGIVHKDGRPTVDGAAAGDRLVAVDGRDPDGAGSDDVLSSLGGVPGAHHRLTLDRNGLPVEIDAVVTRF